MPTYEYVCKGCGHRFDVWQSMSDDPLTICPECGGELRKVFAPPAITFKGSGFYATDHGKKAKTSEGSGGKRDGAAAAKDAGSGSPGSGSGSSSGDRPASPSSERRPGSSSPGSTERSASAPKKDAS